VRATLHRGRHHHADGTLPGGARCPRGWRDPHCGDRPHCQRDRDGRRSDCSARRRLVRAYNSGMLSFFRRRRRRKLLAEPFPPWWEAILKRNVGHYARLTPEEQGKIRDTARILIAEKNWEGVGGLFITDEIKVTVAAQAALLLLGIDHDYYARVTSIVVYPKSFRTPNPEDGWEDDELSDTILSGQAVYRGPVILSWDEVLTEGRDPEGRFNVVLHEFAHQLDFLDNVINGTPPLDDPKLEARWKEVMQRAF